MSDRINELLREMRTLGSAGVKLHVKTPSMKPRKESAPKTACALRMAAKQAAQRGAPKAAERLYAQADRFEARTHSSQKPKAPKASKPKASKPKASKPKASSEKKVIRSKGGAILHGAARANRMKALAAKRAKRAAKK